MKEKDNSSLNFDTQSKSTCKAISGLRTSNSDNVKLF